MITWISIGKKGVWKKNDKNRTQNNKRILGQLTEMPLRNATPPLSMRASRMANVKLRTRGWGSDRHGYTLFFLITRFLLYLATRSEFFPLSLFLNFLINNEWQVYFVYFFILTFLTFCLRNNNIVNKIYRIACTFIFDWKCTKFLVCKVFGSL